jgi:hypothetical protein
MECDPVIADGFRKAGGTAAEQCMVPGNDAFPDFRRGRLPANGPPAARLLTVVKSVNGKCTRTISHFL